jgi:CheY-like chemotaxis protein
MRLTHADRLLPLFDLGALLGLRRPSLPEHGQPVLVLLSQGQRAAIAVDSVMGERELVIQPLPSQLRGIAAFQGASTTVGGELMLVLQPSWLTGAQHAAAVSTPRTRHALVVDDSLTARAMHRAMLEAGGYSVHGVASADLALRQLERHRYELIVCDVAMPEMDGLTFARRVRGDPELARIPLIMVSGRNRAEDRAEALAAGADGFLTKHECISGRLLAEVSRALLQRGAAS